MFEESYLIFLATKSNLEILEELEQSNQPLQFKHLRELVNPKTNKKFSSSTIAAKLKELEEKGMIKNEIVTTSRKKVLGYALTNNGKSALKILRETEEKLKKL